MRIKVFESGHEEELEKDVNRFLKKIEGQQILDIQYQVGMIPETIHETSYRKEQEEESTYSFSVMIVYEK